jgi:hypothetical protein
MEQAAELANLVAITLLVVDTAVVVATLVRLVVLAVGRVLTRLFLLVSLGRAHQVALGPQLGQAAEALVPLVVTPLVALVVTVVLVFLHRYLVLL